MIRIVGLVWSPVGVVHHRAISPSKVSLLLDVVSTEPEGPGGSLGDFEDELLLSKRLDGGEGSSPLLAGGSSCVPGAVYTEQLVLKGIGFGFGGSFFLVCVVLAFDRVSLSTLSLSTVEPVLSASLRLSIGFTLFATTECLREVRVSLTIAVP